MIDITCCWHYRMFSLLFSDNIQEKGNDLNFGRNMNRVKTVEDRVIASFDNFPIPLRTMQDGDITKPSHAQQTGNEIFNNDNVSRPRLPGMATHQNQVTSEEHDNQSWDDHKKRERDKMNGQVVLPSQMGYAMDASADNTRQIRSLARLFAMRRKQFTHKVSTLIREQSTYNTNTIYDVKKQTISTNNKGTWKEHMDMIDTYTKKTTFEGRTSDGTTPYAYGEVTQASSVSKNNGGIVLHGKLDGYVAKKHKLKHWTRSSLKYPGEFFQTPVEVAADRLPKHTQHGLTALHGKSIIIYN